VIIRHAAKGQPRWTGGHRWKNAEVEQQRDGELQVVTGDVFQIPSQRGRSLGLPSSGSAGMRTAIEEARQKQKTTSRALPPKQPDKFEKLRMGRGYKDTMIIEI